MVCQTLEERMSGRELKICSFIADVWQQVSHEQSVRLRGEVIIRLTDVPSNFIQMLQRTGDGQTDRLITFTVLGPHKYRSTDVCVCYLSLDSKRDVTSLAVICLFSCIAMDTLVCKGAWTLITPSHSSIICNPKHTHMNATPSASVWLVSGFLVPGSLCLYRSVSWSLSLRVHFWPGFGSCLTWFLSFLSFLFHSSHLFVLLRPSSFWLDVWFICLTWDSRKLGICCKEREKMSQKGGPSTLLESARVSGDSLSTASPGVWSSAGWGEPHPMPPPSPPAA